MLPGLSSFAFSTSDRPANCFSDAKIRIFDGITIHRDENLSKPIVFL